MLFATEHETTERMASSEMSRLFEPGFSPDSDPNNAALADSQEYALYFRQLEKTFGLLIEWYRDQEQSGGQETLMVKAILEKFLATARALMLKYTCNIDHRLRLDLTESGFPNFAEISAIWNDFVAREIKLNILPPTAILKSKLLDYFFRKRSDSPELLAMLAERAYLESLDPNRLFLPFTPGDLIVLPAGRTADARSYVYFWGCFDFRTNRPYVNIMNFDQDGSAEPLEDRQESFNEFCEVVQGEGSRAPQLAILASAIDDRLARIHPKIIKRVCIGPLYSRFLMKHIDGSNDHWFQAFRRLMEESGQADDDGILLFTDEVVFSAQQQKTRRLLSSSVREIFHIPEDDLECYSRRASVVHHYALLPHYLLQQAASEPELNALEFDIFNKISFTKEGAIYG